MIMATGPSRCRSLTSKTNRNLIERERRLQMKNLFVKLFNLLPPHPSKMSIPQMLGHATLYVKVLQKRMEELKQRKMQLELEAARDHHHIPSQGHRLKAESMSTLVIDIKDLESTIEVNVMAGSDTKFVLWDIIAILGQEGAQVISATYHNAGNKIFLSVHAQVAYARIGIDNFRVHERLKSLQNS